MSFSPYTPPAGSHPPPSTTTYPYGAYPPPHAAYGHPAPGAYPYQATGITGYGWPTYPYGYVPQPAPHIQRLPQASTQVAAQTPAPPPATPRAATTLATYASNYPRENVTLSSIGSLTGRGSRKQSNLRGLFNKELKNLMYGFGDDRNPSNDTVNVMEEILIEYITDVCQTAGGASRKARLSIEDLRRALSRPADAKKLARLEELLFMQEDIKRARAQFEESDIHNPKEF
ncbi:hypothetical protein K443DRAFT_672132 [Laccaria amethystina LaAM-08-1]|uniref:Transcription initiation factor TFIID subunit 13 n=1 Tax=Laccaria amethystina LaAM-08-1 TaxID=1095629 RepID=A0A0C9XUE5_9AGAR|nr:hypothetical protein K443DRAFT_672132 [Laccaria amethystina LaAM-08-1]